MDVAGLTESLRIGDEEGAAFLFDRFAPGLYDYCLTLLDEPEAATEAVRNTLLAAVDRAGQLADPARLEVWLFALARNECLRTARREQAAARFGLASVTGAYRRIRHPGLQELREVSALVRRHGLDHRGVAAVYGIPRWRAKSLAARGDAGGARRITLPPAADLPEDLRVRFLTDAVVRSRAAYRGELAGPYRRRSGFPVPLDRVGTTQRNVLVAAAAVGVITVALLATLPFGARDEVVLTVGKPNAAPLEPLVPTGPVTPSSPTPTAASPSSAPPSVRPTPTTARTKTPRPVTPSRAPASRQPSLPTGPIRGDGNLCVQVVSEYEVEARSCTGGTNQRWTAFGDGTLRAYGKCLNLGDGGHTNGTRIDLWHCNGGSFQEWDAGPNGSLVSLGTRKCMDGPNNASNPRFLQIFGCNGDFYQRWSLP